MSATITRTRGWLRAREREGYFETGRLRARSSSDPLSGKVRTGKSGGYRISLSAADVQRIDAVPGRLNETWFKAERREDSERREPSG